MIEAPLEISYVSLALAVLGVYLLFIGLVSSFLSQKLYISSALVATLIGVGASRHSLMSMQALTAMSSYGTVRRCVNADVTTASLSS